ncbi:MAG TPA: type II toxin-antitoxin system prevent-host-death family antitoxin [Acidimicrobiales bacterium]|nr:type II toxin-antitoxin system prevent-host-death family antitoxin [Acidimicrobiales bacterium]
MAVVDFPTRVLSVTEAHARGVTGLLKDSESGTDTVVERHGRPVAAVISVEHLNELRTLEEDIRTAALLLSRVATDRGERTPLDKVITALGFSRSELESQLRAEGRTVAE